MSSENLVALLAEAVTAEAAAAATFAEAHRRRNDKPLTGHHESAALGVAEAAAAAAWAEAREAVVAVQARLALVQPPRIRA